VATTLSFFIERGFRVSSEDVLRGWKAFLTEEEARLREDASAIESLDMTPGGRAKRFLNESRNIQNLLLRGAFVDLLDYLEATLAKKWCERDRIAEARRSGFAMFHSKKPEGFQRYASRIRTRCK